MDTWVIGTIGYQLKRDGFPIGDVVEMSGEYRAYSWKGPGESAKLGHFSTLEAAKAAVEEVC